MLDFRIATFLHLCETRSYTKTAKLLGITQPSVTQHIKYLQNRFGCKLFTYDGRVLQLTAEGEYLHRQAQQLECCCERVIAELHRISTQKQVLRLGLPLELGTALAASLTAQLPSEEWELSFHTGSTAELVRLLENGTLDVVLADKPAQAPQLHSISVGKVHFGLYATADKAAVLTSLPQLRGEHLLVQETGAGDRALLETLLAAQNMAIDDFSLTESNAPSVLQALAAAGSGIYFAYQSAVTEPGLTPLRISAFSGTQPLVLLHSKACPTEEPLCQFLDVLHNRLKEIL